MRQAVINYHINGLPRSEISAKTGISTGAVSNIIKNWKEKAEEIPDVEDIRGFMKQVYKTGYTVKECAQGFIILQMMESFYDNEEESKMQRFPPFSGHLLMTFTRLV